MSRMCPTSPQGRPTVQLLHSLPDGSQHVDWMIAQDRHGRRKLVTFRLDARLDALAGGQRIEATRLADHRPRYLEYEGPLGGGRGTVTRVAAGRVIELDRKPGAWRLAIVWGAEASGRQRLRLRRRDADRWSIEAVSDDESGDGPSSRLG